MVMWFCVLAAAAVSSGGGDLRSLLSRIDNSWTSELAPDPDMQQHAPNTYAREVRAGHYVLVEPTALPAPYLVATSAAFAARLRLGDGALRSEAFLRLFSGDVRGGAPSLRGRTWATPYALSIYGEELVPNGAGARGDGYGDGRAISIAEVVVEGERWELQLKGSGRTPFARGGDGRAVLRSSVREFLASEAMHALGVPTTRALSLTASATETSQRPWYKNHSSSGGGGLGATTDRRTRAPPARHGGDVMQEEPCAITTRAARSFARVGTFELYGRRARAGDPTGRAQLEQLARHVLWRDYGGDRSDGGGGSGARALRLELLRMAREARQRFADLAADWLRVGYVQSNFNSDNCLASGTTVDYGPFGFIERYDAAWGMWIGSGSHFAFMNQPAAAGRNYAQLVASLEPLFDQGGGSSGGGGDGQGEGEDDDDADAASADLQQLRALAAGFGATAARACGDMWTRKLGLRVPAAGDHAAAVHGEGGMRPPVLRLREALEPLLSGRATGGLAVDYTLFWRQLAEVAAAAATREGQRVLEEARDTRRGTVAAAWPPLPEEERLLLGPLRRAFYGRGGGEAGGGGDADGEEEEEVVEEGGELAEAARSAWMRWLRRWLAQVVADGGHGAPPGNATVQALVVDAAAGASSAAPVPNATATATATTAATASAARAALAAAAASMKRVSPKYVPREWMLAQAYRAAEEGEHGAVHALQRLFAAPYDEQPASAERFYRRAPAGAEEQGGIGFMS